MTQHPSGVDDRVSTARDLMDEFLETTGVVGAAPPRRYLWTDAFAVCNLLELDARGLEPDPALETGYRDLALRLVDQVHHVLGRHREDDRREGWISGLGEDEGEAHPTAGGLRIGKSLPERGAGERADPRLEWERDGQYFHYLTRWMHALLRVSTVTDDPKYLRWAVELAKAAHAGFVHGSRARGNRRLVWKMSIDLSRPQVSSSGLHDPLDGYITYRVLAAAGATAEAIHGDGLEEEIADLATLAGVGEDKSWATEDPLGVGGLLVDAWRVAQLEAWGEGAPEDLLLALLDCAAVGLDAVRRSRILDQAPGRRLPFRELGLAIGVHATERIARLLEEGGFRGSAMEVEERLGRLVEAQALARRVEQAWTDPSARGVETWTDHREINTVMLATSLAPEGYLRI